MVAATYPIMIEIRIAIAEAVYLYEDKLHDFYLPKELKDDGLILVKILYPM